MSRTGTREETWSSLFRGQNPRTRSIPLDKSRKCLGTARGTGRTPVGRETRGELFDQERACYVAISVALFSPNLSSNAAPIRLSAMQALNSSVSIPSARAIVSAKLSFSLWVNP